MFTALLATVLIGIFTSYGVHSGYQYVLGVVLPYASLAICIVGVLFRLLVWAKSPVPFPIPTVGGQQRSLPWIKPARFDAPFSKFGLAGRMFLEVFLFRSLFRNTEAHISPKGPSIVYLSSKWLWFFSLLFHYALLIIVVRHFRFFVEPVPISLEWLSFFDGLFEVGATRLLLSNVLVLIALFFLLLRRLLCQKLASFSLPADYFPLFVLLAIITSGISMRHLQKIDVNHAKTFIMSLIAFDPIDNFESLGPVFFAHIVFVSVFLLCLPFSKLVHIFAVFLSPTRNMLCNSREVRHINPWNDPQAPYRTYAEYEDEFREVMDEAGLPLDKPLAKSASQE